MQLRTYFYDDKRIPSQCYFLYDAVSGMMSYPKTTIQDACNNPELVLVNKFTQHDVVLIQDYNPGTDYRLTYPELFL